jgi:uncharacterized protein (TIGR02599 family)
VTLVLIDEASAARMDTYGSTQPAVIQTNLAGKFKDVTQYQSDLDQLTAALAAHHINYQVLNTSVAIRESEWSK